MNSNFHEEKIQPILVSTINWRHAKLCHNSAHKVSYFLRVSENLVELIMPKGERENTWHGVEKPDSC